MSATRVLESQPPRFAAGDAARLAHDLFGIDGAATALGSERDQTFAVGDAVLKLSNLGEDAGVLDLETQAALHVARVDPSLPLALPRTLLGGGYVGIAEADDGPYFVRAFDRVSGLEGGAWLDDRAVHAYAATHGRLNRALHGFFHAAAGRELLWDLKHTPQVRVHAGWIADTGRRRLVETVLDRFDTVVAPRWPSLRAQVVHGDFNVDNVVFDERGRVSGIFDFGDCCHTAQAADFAIGLASLIRGRPSDDVFRVARIAIDGYASQVPLAEVELALLGDLVAARLAAIVTISAWRGARYPENAEYIQAWDADCWSLLELHAATGAEAWARAFGASAPPADTADLARRRLSTMGSLLTELTYDEPVHVVRGEGVWLEDATGRRLLDAYNNVPVVGHGHPRVTEAVVQQTGRLNTHARYLYEPLVELGERLLASMPPEAGLDTVMLVNSGSEANDMAWRIATGVTGRTGAAISAHAYHGVTAAIAELSPEEWPRGYEPRHVVRFAPPGRDSLGGEPLGDAVARAAASLDGGLAATFVDAGFTSDGVFVPARGELAAAAEATRAAGGLFVADEVQVGHGRSGRHLWAFAAHGVVPDLVTLGKPMGNGYPVAAVITRSALVEQFAFARTVFSTFGGNPVAARAALAVLDVIDDERVVERVAAVGGRLRAELAALGAGEVRGEGLLVGVQLADGDTAKTIVERLRRDGVLIGRTGPHDDVLKIRPPLAFDDEHVPVLVDALRRALNGR